MKKFMLTAALLFSFHSYAAPPLGQPVNPEMHDWYQSLKDPNGVSCCNEADCRSIEEYNQDKEGHWHVLIPRDVFTDTEWNKAAWKNNFGDVEGIWETIPDSKVIFKLTNPTGKAQLCFQVYNNYIYCFLPWETKY